MNHNKKAFTLVELIVVIAILAILGTISFISLQDYGKSSRNSVRLTDIGVMKQSLGIFKVGAGKYPIPNNSLNVTYSGGLLWSQGSFGDIAFTSLEKLSKIPVDPLFENKYDYSVIHNKGKYQIGTVIEGGLFTINNIINETNAVSQRDVFSYISGDYGLYDIRSLIGEECINVTAPSMFVGNIGSTGSIDINAYYTFVYDESSNMTPNYVSKMISYTPGDTFKMEEVYDSCEINTLDELNLYIGRLALSYQQLLGVTEFDEVIYEFNKTSFKIGIIEDLRANGIKIHNDVVLAATDTSEGNVHLDSFTGLDNDELTSHQTDTLGGWNKSGPIIDGSYVISDNSLLKTDTLTGVVSAITALPISSIDRTIIFDLIDFSGGTITIYSYYLASDNYYGVEFSPTGYNVIHEGGPSAPFYPVITGDAIIPQNSNIEINITGHVVTLKINGVNEGIIISDDNIITLGNPAVNISNTNGKIDNFTLIYK